MKNKIILITIGIVLIVLFSPFVYMRISCTGLWQKQVTKIPVNFFTEGDDYTKCVYIGFPAMIQKWKENKLELSYNLTIKKDFIAETFENIYFQYPLVEKYENIEQKCTVDSCELLIKNDENYTLLKILISKANGEDFKDWLTIHGDLLGQEENRNGVSYKLSIGNNKNPKIVFLNRTKVFERGDELSGIKFEIIYLPIKDDKRLENVRIFWMASITDSFNYK
jgi:hypothetical protein